jgi:hypothetical protein
MIHLIPWLVAMMLAQSSRIAIPFLANAPDAAEIGFEGAECVVTPTATSMHCEFQQVFLTTSPVVPDTCLVTTNRYERTFTKDSPQRWISREQPSGACGVVDVATLTDEGGVRWTMELRKTPTRKDARECAAAQEQVETLSWRNIRRPLPCRFVQPGGLSR